MNYYCVREGHCQNPLHPTPFYPPTGAFLLSWAPYAVVSFLGTLYGRRVLSPVAETFPAMAAKCSALWDPLIYLATNQQFRRACLVLCPSCVTCFKCLDSSDRAPSVTALDVECRPPNAAGNRRVEAAQHLQLPQRAGDMGDSSGMTLETRMSSERSAIQSIDCYSVANINAASGELPATETKRN